jgi:carbamoyltransferase
VCGGRIVAAANEERFSRRKLEIAFPEASIAACLRIGSLSPSDIDVVAASTTDPAKALGRLLPSTKESYYRIRRRQVHPGMLNGLRKRAKYWITELAPNALSTAISRHHLQRQLRQRQFTHAMLTLHDHHYCHAVAAAAASGFDRAIVITVDGVGDGAASTVSILDGGHLSEIDRTPAASSPGIFFEHVTNLLNMRELEDEGKVMALASYSPVPASNPLSDVIGADGLRFRTVTAGRSLRSRLARVQWSYPNEQFARMAQDAIERAIVSLVLNAVARTGIRKVALAGGVASNIQVNRRIRLLPEVEGVFVFPHMGDGGLALGAALAHSVRRGGIAEVDLNGLALGPEFDEEQMRQALDGAGLQYTRPASIADAVADLLTRNQVVMWFQGRMEYGPRALGCRSILARADDPSMRDRLNLVLKRRVWFQPFCPSLLESDAARLFCDWRGRPDRFMTMGYAVKGECQKALAGVLGVDGTCRPQIVADEDSGVWAELLRALKARTGTGALLNTSFNIHGEPLVCSPREAADVFRRAGADALACGPFLVKAAR